MAIYENWLILHNSCDRGWKGDPYRQEQGQEPLRKNYLMLFKHQKLWFKKKTVKSVWKGLVEMQTNLFEHFLELHQTKKVVKI